jgi:polyisoprenoid-binding protein YceI
VDTKQSRVYVRVESATRLGHSHGVVGYLAAGSLNANGTGELVFDMTSFVADTPEARSYVGLDPKFSASDAQKVNSNMLGSDVLDVSHYPKAVFSITSCKPLDGQMGAPGRYQFSGSFTLHGAKRPLQFQATLQSMNPPGPLHLRGNFTILQTSYGIQPYSALGGLVRVADALQIYGDFLLVPAGQ